MLSDVYAMGGVPKTAMERRSAVPSKELAHRGPRRDLARRRGEGGGGPRWSWSAATRLDDPELKYGMAVTGIVDPRRIIRNVGAQPGRRARPHQARSGARESSPLRSSTVRSAPRPTTRSSRRWRCSTAAAAEATLRREVHAATDVTRFRPPRARARDGARQRRHALRSTRRAFPRSRSSKSTSSPAT